KITLDTGDVPFWEALDRFCEKAELVETLPPQPAPEPRTNSVTITSIAVVGGGRVSSTDILRTLPGDKPLELTPADGKGGLRPTSRAGALRVRLTPPDTALPGEPKVVGQALLILDVAAEGRFHWQKVVGLRIDRARDEEGRPVAQVPAALWSG